MRHSKEEILNILDQLENKKARDFESETLDFKEWITKPKELYKTLVEYAVCFANQKGGTLVLGVRDNVKGKENAITVLLILSVLRRQRELSVREAISILQLDTIRTREILMKMTGRGYIEKSGVKKGVIFRLSSALYKQFGESISYIRERGIDEVRYPELVLQYVKSYGSISNRQVRELLGVNKYKASRILKKLVDQRKLGKSGKSTRSLKYKLYKE